MSKPFWEKSNFLQTEEPQFLAGENEGDFLLEKSERWKSIFSDAYREFILAFDTVGISPNRLVTLRIGTSIASASILSSGSIENTTLQGSLIAVFLFSLLADRFDGDLARFTNQYSKRGEVLDAGADKTVVYATLLALIWPRILEMSYEQVIALVALFSVNATMDSMSQLSRGYEENQKALGAFWDAPTTQKERQEYAYNKTSNGANIMGKLKTGAIMTALWLGVSQWILWYSQDTLSQILITWLSVSGIFSVTSLWLKWKK